MLRIEVPTKVSWKACLSCETQIMPYEAGVLMDEIADGKAREVAYHRDCLLKMLLQGVRLDVSRVVTAFFMSQMHVDEQQLIEYVARETRTAKSLVTLCIQLMVGAGELNRHKMLGEAYGGAVVLDWIPFNERKG